MSEAAKPTRAEIDAAKETLRRGGWFFHLWHVDDIKDAHPRLTDEQAQIIADSVEENHDCTIGISWEIIEHHVDSLFPAEGGGNE